LPSTIRVKRREQKANAIYEKYCLPNTEALGYLLMKLKVFKNLFPDFPSTVYRMG
jgi:hypothetical protein